MVDHTYQRMVEGTASQKLIRTIAESWDWRLCAPLTVAHRTEEETESPGYYVIDGQHRLAAAEMRGDIDELPCIISRFGGMEAEALCFVSINSARRQISPLDRFHARVAAKEELALKIKALIEGECGATIPRHADIGFWKAKDIGFPDYVGAKMAEYGDDDVTCAILLILAAYPEKVLKKGKELFEGLVYLVAKSQADLHDVEALLKTKRQLEWIIARDKHRALSGLESNDRALAEVFAEELKVELSAPGHRVIGQRRHETKAPGNGLTLSECHAAVEEARTVFPSTRTDPDDEKVFKSGHNSRKIGSVVEKGEWKGFPIYTLTLEERATCPATCKQLLSCYGNNMHLAQRFAHGEKLEAKIWEELESLSDEHPEGFVVRLHVLGDFYSLDYVKLWQRALDEYPALRVWGYTAHSPDSEIGEELLGMTASQWERFAMRFSGSDLQEMAALVIDPPETVCPDNAFICPAQTMKTDCCATCGACWQTERNVAFLKH